MTKRELFNRYILLIIGLFIMALGVALSTKANLGTSPISCIPYVLSLGLPVSFGWFTFFMNIILVLAQFLILRRDFKLIHMLQLTAVVAFSVFTDLTMHLVSGIQVSSWYSQWLLLTTSNIMLAMGIGLEVTANVTMLPGEGFVMAVSKVFHKEFGRVKVVFDFSLVVIGTIISFYLFYRLNGVREGTIAASLSLGIIVRYFIKIFQPLDSRLKSKGVSASFETGKIRDIAKT